MPGDKAEQSVLSGKNRIHFYSTWGWAGGWKESSGQRVWWAKAWGTEFGELPRVYLME